MEREIGKEFEFIGYTLIVSERYQDCKGCFFYEHGLACHHKEIMDITGDCFLERVPAVIFKEIKEY